MEERLKILRKTLNLSQEEFSHRLNMGLSTWGMIEIGRRKLNDRHIKLICAEFRVNEEWLRNGTGEVFSDLIYEDIMKEFQLDDIGKLLFQIYIEMLPEQKKAVSDKIREVAKIIVTNGL